VQLVSGGIGSFTDVRLQSATAYLRVLHKFGHHPRLTELKKLEWSEIPAWAAIEKYLSSGQ
jgi:hypothetical protein